MKNFLNTISEEEKNRILEMHSGKKNVIKELHSMEMDEFLLTESRMSEVFSKIFGKFSEKQKEKISNELEDNFGITPEDSKEEIEDKLKDKFGEVKDPSTFKKILMSIKFGADDVLSHFLKYSIEYAILHQIIKFSNYNIISYLSALIYWYASRFHKPGYQQSKFIRTQRDPDFKEKGPGLKGFDKDYYNQDLDWH
jgi:hypothetical protein